MNFKKITFIVTSTFFCLLVAFALYKNSIQVTPPTELLSSTGTVTQSSIRRQASQPPFTRKHNNLDRKLSSLTRKQTANLLHKKLTDDDLVIITYLSRKKELAQLDLIISILEYHFSKLSWQDALTRYKILANNPDLIENVLADIIKKQATEDIELSLEWLKQNKETPGHDSGAMALGEVIATTQQPSSLLDAVQEKEYNASTKSIIIQSALSNWATLNHTAAFEYANQHIDNPLFQTAIYRLVNYGAECDPENTMTWALSIKNTGLQHSATHHAAKSWLKQDPERYREWKEHLADSEFQTQLP